jgi:hypothetical protein
MRLSCRHIVKRAADTIGVSRTAVLKWQETRPNQNNMEAVYNIRNEYAAATPIHRFILKSGEPAEIRKSSSCLFISAIRVTGQHHIIVLQQSYKPVPDRLRDYRMTDEWVRKVHSGEIKKR